MTEVELYCKAIVAIIQTADKVVKSSTWQRLQGKVLSLLRGKTVAEQLADIGIKPEEVPLFVGGFGFFSDYGVCQLIQRIQILDPEEAIVPDLQTTLVYQTPPTYDTVLRVVLYYTTRSVIAVWDEPKNRSKFFMWKIRLSKLNDDFVYICEDEDEDGYIYFGRDHYFVYTPSVVGQGDDLVQVILERARLAPVPAISKPGDADLAKVVERWGSLTKKVRKEIVGLTEPTRTKARRGVPRSNRSKPRT